MELEDSRRAGGHHFRLRRVPEHHADPVGGWRLSEQVAVRGPGAGAGGLGEKSATLTAEQIQNISIVTPQRGGAPEDPPGMAPITTSNGAPGFNGEVMGINGNGEGGKQSALGNYSANGTQNNALDIVIDGAHASDPGCNCATSVNPNDTIQEFKVLQSNFGAENAKGPVTINVVSKAGGRDFRGTAYTYFRNYHLNSNEWFLNKVGRGQAAEQVHVSRVHMVGCCSSPAPTSTGTATSRSSSSATTSRSRHGHAALVGADRSHAQRRFPRRCLSG